MSAEKLEELKQELENLKTAKRMEISNRLEESKKHGDLSENSEYMEAKEAQSQNEQKIMELEAIIKSAVIIEKTAISSDKVVVGSTVELKSDLFHKPEKFQIVGSEEADPENGKISNTSPLGSALLGHKPGESVEVSTPKGKAKYTIAKIS